MKKTCLTIIMVGFYLSCTQPTVVEPEKPIIIPTTQVKGPGGPAYLAGNILNYLHADQAVVNAHLYVLDEADYADTILHVIVNSTDASFLITEMPVQKVDLIFAHNSYLSRKISALQLKSTQNSFYNPNSSGFFVDSTISMISVADSAGRPNAPPSAIQGYGNSVVIEFKSNISDSVSWNIVQAFEYDTLRIFHYHDPVFDPYPGDVYNVIYAPHTNFLNKERLLYFNWTEEVHGANPAIAVIQP